MAVTANPSHRCPACQDALASPSPHGGTPKRTYATVTFRGGPDADNEITITTRLLADTSEDGGFVRLLLKDG